MQEVISILCFTVDSTEHLVFQTVVVFLWLYVSALLTSIYSVHYHSVQLIHVCSIRSSICTQLMSVVGVDANITSVKRVHWSSTKNQHGASSVASRLVAFLIQPKVHDFDSCLYMAGPLTTCHINVWQFWEPAVCDRKQDPSVLNSHVASAEVRRYQNMISGTSGRQSSMPMVPIDWQCMTCDSTSVL